MWCVSLPASHHMSSPPKAMPVPVQQHANSRIHPPVMSHEAGSHTVDGSEIRRSPVDMENLPLFTGFYKCQVVQDFFHQ